jgi:DNA-binding transcriptional MerR regulator
MQDDFSFTDVERIIPYIKRTTVQMWVKAGMIVPKENREGRGASRVYSFDNLIEISVATELSGWGMSTKGIKSLLEQPGFKNAVKERDVYCRVHYGGGIDSGVTSAMIICISEIAAEIERRNNLRWISVKCNA